jgi:hypothetical protein
MSCSKTFNTHGVKFSHWKCIKNLYLICFVVRKGRCPNYVFGGYFLANNFRHHKNCLKTVRKYCGSKWKWIISQVCLSLGRVDMTWCECLVPFFLQMKEMPVEIIMSQNCQKSRHKAGFWQNINNDPSPRCFCCWEGYI